MTEITLAVGCTAEADTCGSCKFFERGRDYESAYGQCRIKLPKKMADQWDVRRLTDLTSKTQREFIGNEDQIKDTDRCDLQRPDGKTYIVQRRVGG